MDTLSYQKNQWIVNKEQTYVLFLSIIAIKDRLE